MGDLLLFHFRVTNVKLINEKKSHKYYSSNVREPLEINSLFFLRTSYNSMSWDFPGKFKCRSDMDVVSNRWEPIRF